jgi:hypothetical protein
MPHLPLLHMRERCGILVGGRWEKTRLAAVWRPGQRAEQQQTR